MIDSWFHTIAPVKNPMNSACADCDVGAIVFGIGAALFATPTEYASSRRFVNMLLPRTKGNVIPLADGLRLN